MSHDKTPSTSTSSYTHTKRAARLRMRLREINARGEKELAAVREAIEKAKATFRNPK